jgi:signal peptidase II
MNENTFPSENPDTGGSSGFGRGRPGGPDLFRPALLLLFLVVDQLTKWWARAAYSLPDGEPDYFKVTPILGEWLQFRLVYNSGAAFGMKPQEILPFLHPTLFYGLFTAVAIAVLFFYYRKLDAREGWAKTGVALILSGAFGNLIDRLLLHKVTDFIDVGLAGGPRWPTFNVADSCVCVGVGLILAAPLLTGRRSGDAGIRSGDAGLRPGGDAAEAGSRPPYPPVPPASPAGPEGSVSP